MKSPKYSSSGASYEGLYKCTLCSTDVQMSRLQDRELAGGREHMNRTASSNHCPSVADAGISTDNSYQLIWLPFSSRSRAFCTLHKRISNSQCCSCYVWSLRALLGNLACGRSSAHLNHSTMSTIAEVWRELGLISGDDGDVLTPLSSRGTSPVLGIQDDWLASRPSELAEVPKLPTATSQPGKSPSRSMTPVSESTSGNTPNTPGDSFAPSHKTPF